jgi:hypothetical protein
LHSIDVHDGAARPDGPDIDWTAASPDMLRSHDVQHRRIPSRRIAMTLPEGNDGFYRSQSGAFLCKWGPAKARDERCVNKKMCLVATDQQLLADVLAELARREDCYFVKYSVEPKEGMYLGRCFLTDASELGRLWAELKDHPRLMCTLQDDDFTRAFRP